MNEIFKGQIYKLLLDLDDEELWAVPETEKQQDNVKQKLQIWNMNLNLPVVNWLFPPIKCVCRTLLWLCLETRSLRRVRGKVRWVQGQREQYTNQGERCHRNRLCHFDLGLPLSRNVSGGKVLLLLKPPSL